MQIKVKKELGQFKVGMIITVNEQNRQQSRYWRRRLKDAETDGCCEIFQEPKSKKSIKESN